MTHYRVAMRIPAILIILLIVQSCGYQSFPPSTKGIAPEYPISLRYDCPPDTDLFDRRYGEVKLVDPYLITSEYRDFPEQFPGISESSFDAWSRLLEVFKAHNIEIIILPVLPRGFVPDNKFDRDYPNPDVRSAYQRWLADIEANDINAIRVDRSDLAPDHYFGTTLDWTPRGSLFYAQAVLAELDSPAIDLDNSQEGTAIQASGNLRSHVERRCTIRLPREKAPSFKYPTYLTNDPKQRFTVIGTPRSEDTRLGFGDALRAGLGHEIDVFAGSKSSDQWLAWINNRAKTNSPKETVIWELDPSRPVGSRSLFMQIAPTLYGGCRAGAHVAEATRQVDDDGRAQEAMFFPNGLSENPNSLLLDAKVFNNDVNNVSVRAWLRNGETRQASLSLGSLEQDGQRFLLELSNLRFSKALDLTAIDIFDVVDDTGNPAAKSSISLKLCHVPELE